mmetsp:Transcript_42880/g.100491  ORF Transcript_42880/g.100491 Transcript_42880/m.100491 type:complete len:216 (+) Transcript_42880:704-1351(+)
MARGARRILMREMCFWSSSRRFGRSWRTRASLACACRSAAPPPPSAGRWRARFSSACAVTTRRRRQARAARLEAVRRGRPRAIRVRWWCPCASESSPPRHGKAGCSSTCTTHLLTPLASSPTTTWSRSSLSSWTGMATTRTRPSSPSSRSSSLPACMSSCSLPTGPRSTRPTTRRCCCSIQRSTSCRARWPSCSATSRSADSASSSPPTGSTRRS